MSNEHMTAASKASAQLIIPEIANEHYVAEVGITDETMQFGALNRIAEAQLALAYEQRTANLIALFGEGFAGTGFDYGGMLIQIKERLGLK